MSLHELVDFARSHSAYYQKAFAHLPEKLPEDLISILPLTDSNHFWEANTLHNNTLLTSEMKGGIVFKSGGTTGAPKFSVFTRQEWSHFCHTFARGLEAGGLTNNERVANLFYAGELYASFIFIMKSFEEARPDTLHLPLAGSASPETVIKTIQDFNVTTVAGTPTLLVQLAETIASKGLTTPSLRRFLFGGESLYEDQRARLLEILPQIKIQSIGYASVDAGLLGYADDSCGPEEHRTFGRETIYEIINEETGEVIERVGVEGKAYITYLDRKLMPIIRYPVGDRACWSEEKGVSLDRRFKLLGRSEEAARIGPVSVYYDDVHEIFYKESILDNRYALSGFQLILKHFDKKDQLVVRLSPSHLGLVEKDWVEKLLKARPMLNDEFNRGNIHLPHVEIVKHADLEKNPRTGKLKRVIDLRKS
ncbi:MAG: AMP-binding protein [Bacteriovoracaceae bacterium]|nr:AMP-binding protein [Bacteriovoracaceae bacterium]